MQIRRAPRFSTNQPLTLVRFWEDTPIRKVHGRCDVVNRNGFGGTVSDQLYVGEVVRLEMPPMLRGVYASVRNVRGLQHGLEFLLLSDGQHDAIRRLCEMSEPVENERSSQ